jgi:hypothetical protein
VSELLREAAEAHHAAEERLPTHDWADWYGEYVQQRLNQVSPGVAIQLADRRIIMGASM